MKVASDQDYTPTYVEDLASAVAKLAELKAGGVLHLAGSQTLTRAGLAHMIARTFGLDENLIVSAPLREILPPNCAPRPLHSSLLSTKAESLLGRKLWSANQGLEDMRAVGERKTSISA